MNKIKIEITVVVVSLNTKKDTIRTINSILIQSYKNYEILVIDGDSTDGTVEFFKIKKKKIHFFSKKDKGIYFAMNKGIRLSRGNWLIFLNSGDIFYNSKVLENFIQSKSLADSHVIYGNTFIKYKFFDRHLIGKSFTSSTINMPFSHQSVFVRTDILKKKLFNTKYKIAADFDFFYKLFKNKKKFQYLNYFVSKIAIGGISDKLRLDCLIEYLKIFFNNRNYANIFLLSFNFIYYFFSFFIKKILSKKMKTRILLLKYTIKSEKL